MKVKICTSTPPQLHQIGVLTVFRTYALVFGVAGLGLFLLRPALGVSESGGYIGGLALVQVFGSGFFLAAFCAAMLAVVKDAPLRQRSLFWFALAHAAVWLAMLLLIHASWAWNPGLGDTVVSVVGTLGWLLLFIWLSADGEFPRASSKIGFLGVPAAVPADRLRSQYEQKIRQAAAQEERNRLARDLHDSIKQQIFAIQTAAATAQARFDGNSSAAREALDQIRSSAREAMTEMEVMLDQLRAEPLEHTGLVEALKKLSETIGFRTGAQVEFKLGEIPPAGLLAPAAAEATLRAAQEALANVARHARAAHVVVSLDSANGRLVLTIQDDGAGFDLQQTSQGMGTSNMRTRAEELGGKFELTSRPSEGTTVKFSLPYAAADPAETRSKARNRDISIGLLLVSVLFGGIAHHWMLAPAMAFTVGLAVIHYIKTSPRKPNSKMRKLNETAA